MDVLRTAVVWLAVLSTASQAGSDPTALLQEADRLAWLRAWTSAEPLYVDARTIFAARGNERDALYAEVGALRGRLPRMSVPAASAQLASYLELPTVQADDRLRLRVLTVKGDTDVDLDPTLAGESWREALAIAERLGDAPWANRAKGELGLIAFLEGDVGASVVKLGQALKVAQTNGDVSSVVRWLTLFGHGYVQLGRPEEALDFYDRALKAAAPVPELQFPLMTYVGKSNALIRLGRLDEADAILNQAGMVADKAGARGYQAQLLMQRGMIADQQDHADTALALMSQATELAKAAGGNRVVAEIAIEAARIQRRRGQLPAAERSLNDGIAASRAMEERLLLPKLLGELADLRSAQRRFDDAAALLDEAVDMLEGLFTTASSPWVQSRLVSGMDDVFVARIHLEGARRRGAPAMYSAIEQARGRSLLQLLANRPLSGQAQSKELQEGNRRIAELQRQLLRTSARGERRRLLERIFAAEEQLAPVSTEFFDRARRATRLEPPALSELQAALKPDELFLEFALTVPQAYVLVATRTRSRVQALTDAAGISSHVAGLRASVADGKSLDADAQALGVALLGDIPELRDKPRLLVSPDGPLHQVPFELLALGPGALLLDSHIVSYVPSGAVLTRLRRRPLAARG